VEVVVETITPIRTALEEMAVEEPEESLQLLVPQTLEVVEVVVQLEALPILQEEVEAQV
jgi:hypothetical protein